jgi:hypothetical protein
VATHLDETGVLTYPDLILAFSEFCRTKSNTYSDYVEGTIASAEQHKFNSVGAVMHVVLHSGRVAFDELLRAFLSVQGAWDDEVIRFLFELDLLDRPCVYANTPIVDYAGMLESIRLISTDSSSRIVDVPERFEARARRELDLAGSGGIRRLHVRYRTTQFPYMPGKSLNEHYSYCQDKLHTMRSILPVWTAVQPY